MNEEEEPLIIERPREREVFPRRVSEIREVYVLDTEEVLENAIANLVELAGEAHKRATNKYVPTRDRQRWARVEAYIYQTINSLLKTHDDQQVLKKLRELEETVKRLMEEAGEPGAEA